MPARMVPDRVQTDSRAGKAGGENFAALLKRLRVSARLSQEELAERAGISVESVGAYERGKRRAPHSDTLRSLADALALSPELRRALEDLANCDRGERVSPSNRPRNLPHHGTTFVGRRDERADLEALIAAKRLITVVGPGGVGKSRLVVEVASELAMNFEAGAWFVDVGAIREERSVSNEILSAIAAPGYPAMAHNGDDLIVCVADRRMMLILDTCDRRLREVSTATATLLTHSPNVTIVATSREPLNLTNETVYRLDPLAIDAATTLFEERALAINPCFRSELSRGLIESICRALDGLPIAVELAASRLRSVPLRMLASNLDLGELCGSSDLPLRHQTIEAVVSSSYDLLLDEEKLWLCRFATFPGGFSSETICEAWGDGANAKPLTRALSVLVDKSLLLLDRHASGARYAVLRIVRDIALKEFLDSNEGIEAQGRQAAALGSICTRLYAALAENPQPDWIRRANLELRNIRQALSWTLKERRDLNCGTELAAHAALIFAHLALFTEGIDWCDAALAVGDALSPRIEGCLRYGLSVLCAGQAITTRAADEAAKAVDLFRAAGRPHDLALGLAQAAQLRAQQGRFDDALPLAEEALREASDLEDRHLRAVALRSCAVACYGAPSSGRYFQEAAELFLLGGRNDQEAARTLLAWGASEADMGNFRGALEPLANARAIGTRSVALAASTEAAACHLALGELANASAVIKEVLSAAIRTGCAVETALLAAYAARLSCDNDAISAATLFGYARARLGDTGKISRPPVQALLKELAERLRERLVPSHLSRLLCEGASLTADDAALQSMWALNDDANVR